MGSITEARYSHGCVHVSGGWTALGYLVVCLLRVTPYRVWYVRTASRYLVECVLREPDLAGQ